MLHPSPEIKFSGANGDREEFIFSLQLTTCRIGNLTRLIHNLAVCVTIHTYIHTYIHPSHWGRGRGGNGDGDGGRDP